MKMLLALLAMTLGGSLASAQEEADPAVRAELIERLQTLQREYKTATDPEERKRIYEQITRTKKMLAKLSGEGKKKTEEAPPKPDPRAELQGELNRLYREFKETKDSARRAKIRNDIALVMGALKKISESEPAKTSPESEILSLKRKYEELMRIVSDTGRSREDRKKAKGQASDIRKRLEKLQRSENGSSEKAPKKPK